LWQAAVAFLDQFIERGAAQDVVDARDRIATNPSPKRAWRS
jgi:hypothetical protein